MASNTKHRSTKVPKHTHNETQEYMIDYAALAKRSVQSTEKSTLSFPEGETVIGLCGFERGYPTGMPYVAVQTLPALNDKFKRTVITTEQPYVQESEHFHAAAAGRDIQGVCPLKSWAVEHLGAKGGKLLPVTYWAVVPLFFRPNKKLDFQPNYSKPKIMTAKMGKSSQPHIQAQIDEIMANSPPELVPRLFDPSCQQLLVVERKGLLVKDSSFSVSLATGEFAEYQMPDEVLSDIEIATRIGGECDLNKFVVDRFFPDQEEIDKKLDGKASGAEEVSE